MNEAGCGKLENLDPLQRGSYSLLLQPPDGFSPVYQYLGLLTNQ